MQEAYDEAAEQLKAHAMVLARAKGCSVADAMELLKLTLARKQAAATARSACATSKPPAQQKQKQQKQQKLSKQAPVIHAMRASSTPLALPLSPLDHQPEMPLSHQEQQQSAQLSPGRPT